MDNTLTISDVVFYDESRTTALATAPASPCPANGCRNCVIPRPMVAFHYTPGDVVLTGLFDIHAEGSEILSCGALKGSHARNAAAFRYALNTVKQLYPTILRGVELGSLVVDLCDNAEAGRLFLNNVLGSRHIVEDMNGRVVDPNLIKSAIGELDSTEAMSMAVMLGHFGLPYLESSATSVHLNEESLFPTFDRAVPSDYHQMLAIVLILKRMNWDFVQIVHTSDDYGKTGASLLQSEAASRSICIAAFHELKEARDYDAAVRGLQEKPNARVVIAVVDTADYSGLLRAMQAAGVHDHFLLIGTETWGRRVNAIDDDVKAIAQGSITVDIIGQSVTNFHAWLATLNPSDSNTLMDNPFFAEWYQNIYGCYLDAENRDLYTNECNPSQSITDAPGFADTESSYTPFMISATYAVAHAVDKALQDVCGPNYNGICWQFRSNNNVKALIQQHLQDSMFNVNNYAFQMQDGEGMANYGIYIYRNNNYETVNIFYFL